jgi:hypothetical protein
MPVNSVTSGNLHSVTSGAVFNILDITETDKICGFYDGQEMKGRLWVISGSGIQANVENKIALPSDLQNRSIIKFEVYMTRNNLHRNITLGQYLSAWVIDNYFYLTETIASRPQDYTFIVWIYYI